MTDKKNESTGKALIQNAMSLFCHINALELPPCVLYNTATEKQKGWCCYERQKSY